ncbi:hypothetical protein ACBJ59_19470 [Nonomuraea sp. MTCD27]|uniref:hypothetical protein n=1 Tax=Nonomuraea sp. MTCD27 TaxID=1676747 RepID=UPI0035C0DC42
MVLMGWSLPEVPSSARLWPYDLRREHRRTRSASAPHAPAGHRIRVHGPGGV